MRTFSAAVEQLLAFCQPVAGDVAPYAADNLIEINRIWTQRPPQERNKLGMGYNYHE